MSIQNKVQLVGHVGQQPEIKSFGTTGKLAKLSIATNERYKNKQGEWVDNTTWHNLIAWRGMAERIEQQVQKGSHLLIEGRLVNSDYKDKDDIKRYVTEVEVLSFMVLDKKNSQDSQNPPQVNSTQDFYKSSEEDKVVPF